MIGTRGIADMVKASVDRSISFTKSMQASRSVYPSAALTPDDPNFVRTSSGNWTGTFTMPDNTLNANLAYTPVLLQAPLWFPIVAGQEVTFTGLIDLPFASMDGYAGIRYTSPGVIDPSSAYNQNETANNWGTYYVIGSCGSVTQFRARIAGNLTWQAVVENPPAASGWSFQLVTYNTATDDTNDTNRNYIGHAWSDSERPGDVRTYWNRHYTPPAGPIFSNVVNDQTGSSGKFTLSGNIDLTQYPQSPGKHYRVIVTEETDVEYVQAMGDVTGLTSFSVDHTMVITGEMKLRLVEIDNVSHAPTQCFQPVWVQSNSASPSTAYPDMRVEYYSIDTSISPIPTSIQPAGLNGAWSLPHVQNTTGRVRLVDVNTKGVYAEYTMPSGLLRSFIVPPQQAGQTTTSVYYDGFIDTCFMYDQAVALIALIQMGEFAVAQNLINALLLSQNDGGSFPFARTQSILNGNDYSLLRTGAIAWVVYALLIADMPTYRSNWTTRTNTAATSAMQWIINNTLNTIGLFKGGIDSNGNTPWWSTEHNIDAWWCLDLCDRLYGSSSYNWRYYADGVKNGLMTYAWDATDGVFWQGGGHTVDTANDGAHALDMHTWGGAVLEKWGLTSNRDSSFARAWQLYYMTDPTFHLSGFTTFLVQDGYPTGTVESPWCEGTFGMAAALRNSDPKRAYGLIATMARGQLADGSYRYTLVPDPVNQINTFPCLIGTAWNVLAHSGPETPNTRVLWT